MHPVEQAARDILAVIEATYQPTHQYVAVDPTSFRHLDLRFYDRTAERLAGHGFRVLGDVEDTTLTNAPDTVLMPALIRSLTSRDGTVMATLYHARLKTFGMRLLLWLLRKLPGTIVDMETEFSDGSFVVTSSAASAAAMELPTLIDAEYLPKRTSAVDVYTRHSERVAAHLTSRPGVTARAISSHGELVASQNRMNAIKAAFRGEIEGITREELERLTILSRRLADDVYAAVRREQQIRLVG